MFEDKINYTTILERLKAFDQDAFEQLYLHARERLYVYALSILKDEATAQDIVQELFVDFWEEQIFLRIHTGLAAYLIRTVRNRSLDYIKTEQNRSKIRKAYFGENETIADAVEARVLGEEIEAAINKLPQKAATVFRLHYIVKLSHAEIAEQLQISINTVGNHITRALKELRETLKIK